MKSGLDQSQLWDLVIVGGGLVGGLLAYRLLQTHPDWRVLLIHSGETLGGDHTWCFHQSDVSSEELRWMAPLIGARWDGYSIHFPRLKRHFDTPYFMIRSGQFHSVIHSALPEGSVRLNCVATHLQQNSITLNSGEVVRARQVIDARGLDRVDLGLSGYQKFTGMDLKLLKPHGVTRPLLMDASVPQEDGFQFVYVLPLDDHTLLVEDTRFSDHPLLDRNIDEARIRHYCSNQGWEIDQVMRVEQGVLPIPFRAMDRQVTDAARSVGMRGEFFHPSTGYSLPQAVRLATWFGKSSELPDAKDWLQFSNEVKGAHGFYQLLNRMLFLACSPQDRVKVMEVFYRHPETLIRRFYAGTTTRSDRLKILMARPPVSVLRALRCLV